MMKNENAQSNLFTHTNETCKQTNEEQILIKNI